MRFASLLIMVLLAGCADDTRLYEQNYDFTDRCWPAKNVPSFEFTIQDNQQPYALYCNLRNTVAYPYSRIFIRYSLKDSAGHELKKEMIGDFLFDQKTGEPKGVSGLGDIYDQQLPLLKDYTFPYAGPYSIQFEQFMRTDSLQGVLAVGLRVEKTGATTK